MNGDEKMKNRTSNIVKVLASCVAMLTMSCSFASLSSYAFYTPQGWSVKSSDPEDRPKMQKHTDSPVYVSNTSEYSVKFGILGSNTLKWGDGYLVSQCSQYSEVLKTSNLYIPGNSQRLVRQYIYEIGYTYAAPFFQRDGHDAEGQWSADTVATYEYIN